MSEHSAEKGLLREWVHSWWITLRHGTRLTRSGRTLLRALADPLTEYVEVERPSHEEFFFDLTTPRQYTARGGWNANCACGVKIGESQDDDLEARHDAHRTAVFPPGGDQ